METRRLGRTEWQVSTIGMGGIPIQRVNLQEATDIVNEALNQGMSFFDTARGYTDSEEKFGNAFKGKNKTYYIATKSGNFTKEGMAKEIEVSLEKLQVDQIDLYQLHNVRTKDALKQVLSSDGALAALKEAKKAGRIKEIGITGHVISILTEALQTDQFATVQFPFNAVETAGVDELIKVAERLDVGMIVMKPFAGGALTEATLALKFILDYPVSTVIPGMDNIEQVKINGAIGKRHTPLTDTQRNQLMSEVKKLGKSFCRRCDYCSPCPQGIDIPSTFILDSYWTRYGLKDWAVERYNGMKNNASKCIACGECEIKCPYNLPIISMLASCHENMSK